MYIYLCVNDIVIKFHLYIVVGFVAVFKNYDFKKYTK